MIARTLRVEVDPARVEAVIVTYRELVRPIHAEAVGLRRHYVLADRTSGRIVIVGIWDSAESIEAVKDVLEPAREKLWAAFGEAPAVEVYEVADELTGRVAEAMGKQTSERRG